MYAHARTHMYSYTQTNVIPPNAAGTSWSSRQQLVNGSFTQTCLEGYRMVDAGTRFSTCDNLESETYPCTAAGPLTVFYECAKVTCGTYSAGPPGIGRVNRPGDQILFGESVIVECGWREPYCYRAGGNTRVFRRCVPSVCLSVCLSVSLFVPVCLVERGSGDVCAH